MTQSPKWAFYVAPHMARKLKAVVLPDHLSSLTKDCLVDIFERLDHDDIDELATLSAEMDRIADSSRKNALKVKATSLWVAQIDELNFELGVDLEGQKYTLRTSNEDVGLFTKGELFGTYGGFSIEKQIPTITEAVTKKAAAVLHRFHFSNFEFHKICIDEYFLEFFMNLYPSSLRMKFVRFDDSLSKESVASKLLSGRLEEILLDWNYDNSFFDEIFLTKYAQTVAHPRLTLNDSDQVPEIWPRRQFAQVLAKFEHIESQERLVIDADWVMSAVVTRLRDRRAGRWQFRLTRDIAQHDVDAALREEGRPYDVYVGRRQSWGIRIPGTQHEVYVKSVDDTLDAIFR